MDPLLGEGMRVYNPFLMVPLENRYPLAPVPEPDVRFADDLRKLRNTITYAGDEASASDAAHVIENVERIRTMIGRTTGQPATADDHI